ncbi:hypothetical protein DERP_008431 [Dermatophagoides pteronyssinus]|uniref:Uncharacterized protein n=1 Tax=Dermatophagoides pteronyssinus TaxID=6956 RepID=A0ABQ8IVL3_DERPT|nr:hypothetical protein DERP_008431 [Dermatophagoides pteronyssinus]
MYTNQAIRSFRNNVDNDGGGQRLEVFDVVAVVVVCEYEDGREIPIGGGSTLERPGKNAVDGGVGGNGLLFPVAATAAAAFNISK